jgi:adenylate cyclase
MTFASSPAWQRVPAPAPESSALGRLVRRWLNLGIDEKTERSLVKNVQVMNALGSLVLVSHVATLPLTFFYFEVARPALFVCLLMMALTSVALLLNARRRYFAAAVLGALAAVNNITLYTLLLGTRTNVHFLMPAVMIGAFYYFSYRHKRAMFLIVGLSLLAFLGLEVWSIDHPPLLRFPEAAYDVIVVFVDLMFVVTTFGFMLYGYTIYRRSEESLEIERGRSESLLMNILPEAIAVRLKNRERRIADRHDLAAVLFVDIVSFTKLSARITAEQLVTLLDGIFSEFDVLVERAGVEKIKTIGDAYMIAAGLADRTPEPVRALADLALSMMDRSRGLFETGLAAGMDVRIGLSCGPVVAGVIGTKRFAYDLWGDTVNVASRMESHGEPGKIHVTAEVQERLGREYLFEDRGEIKVKGKGPMRTYFLLGKRPQAEPRA